MAADPHHIDPTAYLEDLLAQASPDLMRQMLNDFINQILSTQAGRISYFTPLWGVSSRDVTPSRANISS